MFIKSKICFTVFVLYEIAAITVLHLKSTCSAMFGMNFCASDFKYFAGAIAIPLLVYLIWMWIREIIRIRRRRHFIGLAKNVMTGITTSIHERLKHISPNDLEQIITAAILICVKKYSMRHPGLRKTIDEILGASYDEYAEYDQEYAEIKQTGTKKRTASKRPASTRKSKKK